MAVASALRGFRGSGVRVWRITSGGRASTDGVTLLKGASKNFTVHVLVVSPFGGVSGREACDTTGENVIVAETRVRVGSSGLRPQAAHLTAPRKGTFNSARIPLGTRTLVVRKLRLLEDKINPEGIGSRVAFNVAREANPQLRHDLVSEQPREDGRAGSCPPEPEVVWNSRGPRREQKRRMGRAGLPAPSRVNPR